MLFSLRSAVAANDVRTSWRIHLDGKQSVTGRVTLLQADTESAAGAVYYE